MQIYKGKKKRDDLNPLFIIVHTILVSASQSTPKAGVNGELLWRHKESCEKIDENKYIIIMSYYISQERINI